MICDSKTGGRLHRGRKENDQRNVDRFCHPRPTLPNPAGNGPYHNHNNASPSSSYWEAIHYFFNFIFLSLRISFHVIGHRRPLSASVSISLTSAALFDGQTRLLFQVADQFWSCAQCRLHVHQCLGASFLTSERHARGFWCGLGGRYPLFKQGYLTRGAGWCWMFCAHVRQDMSRLERETPR